MIAKIETFQKTLLDHEDLKSSKLLASFKKLCTGKYLPPLHKIFVQRIPIQKCF